MTAECGGTPLTCNDPAHQAPANETIVATRAQIAAAFDEWKRRNDADPDAFQDPETDDGVGYGTDCADYLAFLIGALS